MEVFKLLGTLALQGVDEAKKDINDVTGTAEKSSSKIGSVFSKIGKFAGTCVKGIATGIGVAAGAIGTLTVKSLSMAGELEQNMGGSEAVFGKYADKMQDKAKQAFSNMGLSTSDYLATANKMGALFQGAGFSVEESMNLSSDAMQRAADVASIMGIDTSSAMEAVAGAAKGNFTMMDNLGVAMNETTLANYALEKGMKKSYDQMTQQEKIGVAMEMFMDKTAYAAGNYAKENETLAGSLGTAKAALSNFLSGSGSVDDVVSSLTNAGEVVVKNIQELFPKLMTGLTQLLTKLVPMIPPLLQDLLPPLISGAISLVNGIVDALPQILNALMGIIPGLLEGIMQIFEAIIQALPGLVEMITSSLVTLLPSLIDGIISLIVSLCTNFSAIIQPIIDYLPDIIISIVDALMNNLPILIQGIINLVMGIVEAIPQIISGLIKAIPTIIKSVLSGIINAFPVLLNGVLNLVSSLFKSIFGLSDEQMSRIKNLFKSLWEGVKTIFKTAFNNIKTIVSTAFNNIKIVVQTFVNVVKNIIKVFTSVLKGDWKGAWEAIKNIFKSVWNGIKNIASNTLNGLKNIFTNTWNGIKKATSTIWNGIKNAITKPIQDAKNKVTGWIDNIKNAFSKFKAKIKMPHIKIENASWNPKDWIKNGIPKFKVEWYKEGGVLTEPTIFDYNPSTNTAKVGGEAGPEAVAPIDTLQDYVQKAVKEENSEMTYHIQRIYEILAKFLPIVAEGMNTEISIDGDALAAKLAPKMDKQLGQFYSRKARYTT